MTTRLSLYNDALLILKERKLASLSENRESRRVLDTVWDSDFVDYVLEQGLWNFAMRAAKLEIDEDVDTSGFGGFRYAFAKPADWVRIAAVSADAKFWQSLEDYTDEGHYLFADIENIYVRYVSNAPTYGNDLSLWPVSFAKYASAYMAVEACGRITQDKEICAMSEALMTKRLSDAKSKDAQKEPSRQWQHGSWANARLGFRGYNRNRENG